MMNKKEKQKNAGWLSVCIIAKNEEKNIERCLACLKLYGFEVIVVDTGSTDRTKEIALQYTKKVYDFPWCDDFAAARNFALSKAEKPYIMVLDCDEFLEKPEVGEIEKLYQELLCHTDEAGRICIRNTFRQNNEKQENCEWVSRIFPKDNFYYEGRIHEQIVANDGKEYGTYQSSVVVEHIGYDLTEEERKNKTNRNITLLMQELELLEREQNEQQLPYILYQLGKSYYMAGEYANACEYFSRGLSYDLNPKLEYVIDMVETYGYALLNSNQAETALFFENIYEEFGNSADFQFLMGLIYMNNARFEEAVDEFQKATEHKNCRNKGVNSYSAYYNIGVIYECLGKKEEAVSYYKKCREYEPAKRRIADIVAGYTCYDGNKK